MLKSLSKFFLSKPKQAGGAGGFMPWSNRFRVGVRAIDNDHRQLFGIVNSFHESFQRKQSPATIASTFVALEKYVEEHFSREEGYMESANYPELGVHKLEHEDLLEALSEHKRKYQMSPANFDHAAFLAFLKKWLTEHILTEDRRYVPYVRGEK